MSEKKDKNKLWKSIKEYHGDPDVLKSKLNEFNEGVTEDFNPEDMSKFSRRKFLAILAASSAYAATACTSYRDKGEIVPYVNRPEEILPGKPTYYASTFYDEGLSYGILVKTREGRPIKIEGNPDDSINKGKIPSKVHSSILNLYDPERIREPRKDGRKISWQKTDGEIREILLNASSNGKEIALITGQITSPTTKKVIKEFIQKYPNTKQYSVQLSNQSNRINAWKKSYNQNMLPAIKWDQAKLILALEADFLGKEGNTAENRMLYVKGRNIVETGELNRLYSVEAGMSLTGMNADVRLRLKPELQFNLVLALMKELSIKGIINKNKIDQKILSLFDQADMKKIAEECGLDVSKLNLLVNDLSQNLGNSIVYAGDTLPEETHILVNLINDLLGNSAIHNFDNAFLLQDSLSTSKEITELVSKLNNEKFGAVIHFESNPVYELPAATGYQSAIEKLDAVITLSETPNETTKVSKYILPVNNILESWGDHQTRNGQITLQQPVILPLFNTRQRESILLNWISDSDYSDDQYQSYLKNSLKDNVYDKGDYVVDFDTFWNTALHNGVVEIKKISSQSREHSQTGFRNGLVKSKGVSILLHSNNFFGNGKYANNGWLQELPHPVTKVAWDNFAAISPKTAGDYNLVNDDLIKISLNGSEIELPIIIQPGMADETIVTELGYGRTNSGEVANDVGFNVNNILNPDNISQYIFEDVSISSTGIKYKLASTQEHHSLDDEFIKDFHRIRKIIQDGTIEEYKRDPKFLHKNKHEIFSITESHEYKNEKWAMSIDLNKCLGCSECISSCNVENNVPIVGKDQVSRGREMQWIRIDRYYSGTPEEPLVSTQPMLCQHCDNAPCENVCPVNATNHSPDGLNQMAYNRCVGTRYCANNCPYKVRRFNFYNFRDHFADSYYDNELSYLVNNPEVTVRSRGVIEKCTFCIQNIMEVREKAIKEGRDIMTDEVKTSCQSACPTDAIVFGDSNNSDSKVTKHIEHDLSYHVLEELNVRPNVTYLAKIRNTHTEDS